MGDRVRIDVPDPDHPGNWPRLEKDFDPVDDFSPDIDLESVDTVSEWLHESIVLTRVAGMGEDPDDISIAEEFLFVVALPDDAHAGFSACFAMMDHCDDSAIGFACSVRSDSHGRFR